MNYPLASVYSILVMIKVRFVNIRVVLKYERPTIRPMTVPTYEMNEGADSYELAPN